MLIYHYNPANGALLGTSSADESPEEPGVFLIPAYATPEEPPADVEGNIRVFVDGEWLYISATDPEADPDPEPHAPTMIDVARYRDVLLAADLAYDFGEPRGVKYFRSTPDMLAYWAENTRLATAAMLAETPLDEIRVYTTTGAIVITAADWIDVMAHAGDVRQKIWESYLDFQTVEPIPENYQDAEFWP